MRRIKRDYLGLSLLVTAVVLTFVFLITCIRKKNVLAALAAVAAISATGGYLIIKRNRVRHGGYLFDFFDENNYEVFDDDEVAGANSDIRAGLHKLHDNAEHGSAMKPVYEIPVDDETTEEDFTR